MCLEIRAQAHSNAWRSPAHIDHDRLVFGAPSGQAHHDPGEDPVVAPALPPVVEGLRRAVFLRRVILPQTTVIDEDNPAQNVTVIDAELPLLFEKKGLRRTICVSVNQNRLVIDQVSLDGLNHDIRLKSMRPEPSETHY